MLIEEELARSMPERDTAVTIGVFDGVHVGHQALIAKLKERAVPKSPISAASTA